MFCFVSEKAPYDVETSALAGTRNSPSNVQVRTTSRVREFAQGLSRIDRQGAGINTNPVKEAM